MEAFRIPAFLRKRPPGCRIGTPGRTEDGDRKAVAAADTSRAAAFLRKRPPECRIGTPGRTEDGDRKAVVAADKAHTPHWAE